MPIVDITGFSTNEVEKMRAIRIAIQKAFQERWGLARLDETSVNFFTDPSIEPSPNNHCIARIYTKRFVTGSDEGRDRVCDIVHLLLETHGDHVYNEACAPGYSSMRGRWNPDFIEKR